MVSMSNAVTDGADLVWDEVPNNTCYDWALGDEEACAQAFAGAHHVAKLDLVNNRLIAKRDGAAKLYRGLRHRDRQLHPVHVDPEPSCDSLAHGGVRARTARAQAPGGRPRCRRRLRLQDLPLRGGGDRHLGDGQDPPAHQVDGGAFRVIRLRRSGSRPRHPRRARPRRGRQSSSASRSTPSPTWGRISRPSRPACRPGCTGPCSLVATRHLSST